MRSFMIRGGRVFAVGACLTVFFSALSTEVAARRPPPRPKHSGRIVFIDDNREQAIYKFEGFEEQVGRFTARGELDFVPGDEEGSLEGTGVVIVTSGCDRLVGVATVHLDANGESSFRLSWRDSITLRNGRTLYNTGRFREQRPTGLIVIVGVPREPTIGDIITIIIIIILRT